MKHQCIADDVKIGENVYLGEFINLYGCSIGAGSRIGPFVEIQCGAEVGRNCKISSHSFLCEGVTVADDVFIGHGVIFINDKHPRATNASGATQSKIDWVVVPTIVKKGASIGSGAIIMCGITIGERATVGAGSIVLTDVAADSTVVGNPSHILRTHHEHA